MAVELSSRSIVVASPDQVSWALGDESAILSLSKTIDYGLSPVGTRVWRLLRQPRNIGELRDAHETFIEVQG